LGQGQGHNEQKCNKSITKYTHLSMVKSKGQIANSKAHRNQNY